MKNYIGGAAIITILALGLSSVRISNAYRASVENATLHTFSVQGEGRIVTVPDIALLEIGVVTEGGTNIGAIQKENTKKTNASIEFIKSKGVSVKDIETKQYALEPRYSYTTCTQRELSCPPSKIVGYTIQQALEVKVRKFDVIGDILAGAVGAGANTISGPSFSVEHRKELQNKARAEAILDAQKTAQTLATSAGLRLGKLVSIDESYAPGPLYRSGQTFAAQSFEAGAPSPTIEPGSENIVVHVTIQFELR